MLSDHCRACLSTPGRGEPGMCTAVLFPGKVTAGLAVTVMVLKEKRVRSHSTQREMCSPRRCFTLLSKNGAKIYQNNKLSSFYGVTEMKPSCKKSKSRTVHSSFSPLQVNQRRSQQSCLIKEGFPYFLALALSNWP